MKQILLIGLMLTICSCSSQSKLSGTQPVAFTYNWQISNGELIITYANKPYGDIGSSPNVIGEWRTSCKQTYLDFINKLVLYGSLPAHNVGASDRVDGLEILTEASYAFILMVDTSGRVWRLLKPEALILATQLNQIIWIGQISLCPDTPCICN